MPRPRCCRRVGETPPRNVFKPAGVPLSDMEEMVLAMDEFEAIRLADLEGLYHEQAAGRMDISRQTFGRILESARGKIARVLVNGFALRIEGGPIEAVGKPSFKCGGCQHRWGASHGISPAECPVCKSKEICCLEDKADSGAATPQCRQRPCKRR